MASMSLASPSGPPKGGPSGTAHPLCNAQPRPWACSLRRPLEHLTDTSPVIADDFVPLDMLPSLLPQLGTKLHDPLSKGIQQACL